MLSEKNIPFQVTEIDLKNKPDWFLEVSPYGKVPVLDHDGELVYESAVINEYLDETFTDVPARLNRASSAHASGSTSATGASSPAC